MILGHEKRCFGVIGQLAVPISALLTQFFFFAPINKNVSTKE
jgi:hypothetical protein